MTTTPATHHHTRFDDLLEEAWAELLMDIRAGLVPDHVRSFTELHDYVDANEYVPERAIDWGLPPAGRYDLANELTAVIDARLAEGQHHADLRTRPGVFA